jgi:hypothetical protein
MKKILVYIFPLALFLVSCDREAKDITPPVVEAQLVVFSFLSPEDSLVKVEVSMSQPVYGYKRGSNSSNRYVEDAVVTIKNDGGFSATLTYVDTSHVYVVATSAYPIEPGRTYTVAVSGRGKYVSGSCTVPKDTVQFSDITYEKRTDIDGTHNTYLYKWKDEPGTTNYYRTTLESQYTYIDFFGDTTTYPNELCSNMYSDENRNGQQFSGTCDGYTFYGSSDTASIPVDFYLLNTDIHYYEYHKRRLNYYGDDPFSEPFQQYSNVKDGLGVISAYRLTKKTLIAKP